MIRLKAFIAGGLSFALVLGSPGLDFYQAAAQGFKAAKISPAPLPAAIAGASAPSLVPTRPFNPVLDSGAQVFKPFPNKSVSDTELLQAGREPREIFIPSDDVLNSRDPQAPKAWAQDSFEYFAYGFLGKASPSDAAVPARPARGEVLPRAPPKLDTPPAWPFQNYGVRHRNFVSSVSSIETKNPGLAASQVSSRPRSWLSAGLAAGLFFTAPVLHAAGLTSSLASDGVWAALYSAAPGVIGAGALAGLAVYVLRQKGLPKSLRGLMLGHNIFITFGIYLHVFSQSFLAQNLTGGNMALVGGLRGLHYAAYALFSFLPIGPAVKKTDYKVLFAGTSIARAVLMGLIPWSWMRGSLGFPLLSNIVAVNPLPQNMMTTADSAATASVLSGADDELKKETAVVKTKVNNLGKIVIQFLAGWTVSVLAGKYGNPGGYAMAYAGYGAMLLLSVPVFLFLFQDPRHADPGVKEKPSKNWLYLLYPVFHPVWVLVFRPIWVVFGALYNALRFIVHSFRQGVMPRAVLKGFFDRFRSGRSQVGVRPFSEENPGLRERLAGFLEKFETVEGLGVILRDKVLLIMVAVSVIPILFADALGSVLLPAYVSTVIVPRLDLAHWPLAGSLLGTAPGIFTLMMTAGSLGGYLGSKWLEGEKGSRRIENLGHSKLYKAAAFGSLLFVFLMAPLFWMPSPELQSLIQQGGKEPILQALNRIPLGTFWAGLGIVLSAQFLKEALHTLLKVAMEPVLLNHIPKGKEGTFYSAFQMIQVALMGAGSLTVGIVIGKLSVAAGLVFISSFFAVHALVQWWASGRLGRENPKGWQPGKP